MLAMTSNASHVSAQELSYAWLKEHIRSLPRGDGVFLTESEVAAQAGTSRTPVREALLRLQTEGFLTIVPKKGAYVPPVSHEDVEAVVAARELVEDWCVRRVAADPGDLVPELEHILAEQDSLKGDPMRFIECDRRFHRAIVFAGGNSLLFNFYESLRERQVRMGMRAIKASEDRGNEVMREHRAIVDAIRNGDGAMAGEAVTEHLAKTFHILRSQMSGRSSWALTIGAGEDR